MAFNPWSPHNNWTDNPYVSPPVNQELKALAEYIKKLQGVINAQQTQITSLQLSIYNLEKRVDLPIFKVE